MKNKENYESFLEELKKLTNSNSHTEARLLIAEFFELKHYIKIFKAIAEIHNAEGYLPAEISTFRQRKTDNLIHAIDVLKGFRIAKEVYSKL